MKKVGYINKYGTVYGNIYASAKEATENIAQQPAETVPVYDVTQIKTLIETAIVIAETRGEVHSAAALRFILAMAR